ncbi:MAG: tRNA-dihydrouridine synthase family protein [Bdellovibrionaceae bacterium]|nr:tRNA-dihydrouridine synthase family protein [Pseudobdellovibrionaceae bacterium]
MRPDSAELWRRALPGDSPNFPLCLAPMVGLSHVALRLVLRSYLPAGAKTPWPTEMLSSRKLPQQKIGLTPETARGEDEDVLVPQILGNEEASIRDSVRCLQTWGAAGIDINMGCPVEKALRHNYGVALMGDPAYAAQVVEMTVRHARVPVSVKLRAGPQGDFDFLKNFVGGLKSAGAAWITLHPRTAEQKRRGRADWSQIRRLKRETAGPLVGNGDIQTAEDVFAMLDETGCDMVMAGRALAARPWLLWQVGEDLGWAPPPGKEGREAPRTPLEEGAEYGRALLALIAHSRRYFNEDLALRKVRFHLRTTTPWLTYGHTLMSLSTRARHLEEFAPWVEEFFSAPQEMSPRTDLLS